MSSKEIMMHLSESRHELFGKKFGESLLGNNWSNNEALETDARHDDQHIGEDVWVTFCYDCQHLNILYYFQLS